MRTHPAQAPAELRGSTAVDDAFLERLRAGERRTVARALSLVERGGPPAASLLERLYPVAGAAWRIGITGPPGAGKSTLIAALTRILRRAGRRVAVLAVDPSSPFTSGALLGDRVRMADIDRDPEVLIRSMATRGAAGGLAAATAEAADVLAAAGFDPVLIETVGVGQVELDIGRVADTTVMVLVPEAGDEVQAIKAGLMEIADLYVLNKADRPDAARAAALLAAALTFKTAHRAGWQPPVIKAVAAAGEGVEAVLTAVERHRGFLEGSGELARRRRAHAEARISTLATALLARELAAFAGCGALAELADDVGAGRRSPRAAAEALVARYMGHGSAT